MVRKTVSQLKNSLGGIMSLFLVLAVGSITLWQIVVPAQASATPKPGSDCPKGQIYETGVYTCVTNKYGCDPKTEIYDKVDGCDVGSQQAIEAVLPKPGSNCPSGQIYSVKAKKCVSNKKTKCNPKTQVFDSSKGGCVVGSEAGIKKAAGVTPGPAPCSAASTAYCEDPAIKCSQNNCDLIGKYVNPGINLLSVSFGLLAVISIILGSINYATSEGDAQKASRAKQRIVNTIFAVIAYLFMYSFLQFLVPGGLFNR